MDGPNLRSRRHEERTVDGRHAAWDRRRHSTVQMVAIVSEEAYAEDFYSRGKTVEVGGELALVIARIGIAYRRGGCLFYFFRSGDAKSGEWRLGSKGNGDISPGNRNGPIFSMQGFWLLSRSSQFPA